MWCKASLLERTFKEDWKNWKISMNLHLVLCVSKAGGGGISWVWPLETLALFVYRTYVQPQNFQRRKTERWAQDSHIFKLDKWRANLVTLSCYREKPKENQITIKRQIEDFHLSAILKSNGLHNPKMKSEFYTHQTSFFLLASSTQVNGLFKVPLQLNCCMQQSPLL